MRASESHRVVVRRARRSSPGSGNRSSPASRTSAATRSAPRQPGRGSRTPRPTRRCKTSRQAGDRRPAGARGGRIVSRARARSTAGSSTPRSATPTRATRSRCARRSRRLVATILDEAASATGSRPFATGTALDRARRDFELFVLQHRLDPLVARLGRRAVDVGAVVTCDDSAPRTSTICTRKIPTRGTSRRARTSGPSTTRRSRRSNDRRFATASRSVARSACSPSGSRSAATHLLAIDVVRGGAAAGARARSPACDVQRREVPEEFPAGPFDLIVASEVLYYLDPPAFDANGDAIERALRRTARCSPCTGATRPQTLPAARATRSTTRLQRRAGRPAPVTAPTTTSWTASIAHEARDRRRRPGRARRRARLSRGGRGRRRDDDHAGDDACPTTARRCSRSSCAGSSTRTSSRSSRRTSTRATRSRCRGHRRS